MECAQNIGAGQWDALLYVARKVLHIKTGQAVLWSAAEPQTQYQQLAIVTAGYEAIYLHRCSLQHHSVLPKLEECSDCYVRSESLWRIGVITVAVEKQ